MGAEVKLYTFLDLILGVNSDTHSKRGWEDSSGVNIAVKDKDHSPSQELNPLFSCFTDGLSWLRLLYSFH
jgi:hypothetical protein